MQRTFFEAVALAFRALGQAKIRTALTILGVGIGVIVVVVMAAIITGIDRTVDDLIEAAGPSTFYVVRSSTFQASTGLEEEDPEWLRRPPIPASFARDLRRTQGVANAYPVANLTWFDLEVRADGREVEVNALAVAPDYLVSDPGDITAGRWYTDREDAAGRPVAVIDSATARELYAPLDAVGKTFRLAGQSFTVIGVYHAPPNLFSAISGNQIFVPFHTAEKHLLTGGPSFVSFEDLVQLAVVAGPSTSVARTIDQVIGRLRSLRGLGPGDENDFDIVTQDAMTEQWNNLSAVLFAVMFALSSAGLMVGGVGVIAVMVVSVTERTREIGIRKALGAARRDILWQFLIEAATLTTVGGALGLGFGAAAAWAVGRLTPVPAVIPLWSIFVALLMAAITGILFGIVPAARAARLDPVRALRYE